MKVLVASATRNSGLAIIRSLANEGYHVTGADERRLPFDTHSCFSRPYHFYPDFNSDTNIEAILNILKQEKPDFFFPGTEIRDSVKYQQKIQQHTRMLVPSITAFETAFNKLSTHSLCQSLGIDTPALYSPEQARRILQQHAVRPIVIKPSIDIGGSRGLSIAKKAENLDAALLQANQYAQPMIQEYIPGSSANMRTVNLLFDKASNLAAYFTTQKLREWPATGGVSVLSISTDERELVDWILPFFQKLHWQGPAEVEIKIDERDNTPKLIEINPRFSGYIGFAIECGVNFPTLICDLSLEDNPPVNRTLPTYQVGIKYIHTSSFIRSAIHAVLASANKMQTLTKLHQEWQGQKVGNYIKWCDWQVILMKTVFEMTNKGDKITVQNQQL